MICALSVGFRRLQTRDGGRKLVCDGERNLVCDGGRNLVCLAVVHPHVRDMIHAPVEFNTSLGFARVRRVQHAKAPRREREGDENKVLAPRKRAPCPFGGVDLLSVCPQACASRTTPRGMSKT